MVVCRLISCVFPSRIGGRGRVDFFQNLRNSKDKPLTDDQLCVSISHGAMKSIKRYTFMCEACAGEWRGEWTRDPAGHHGTKCGPSVSAGKAPAYPRADPKSACIPRLVSPHRRLSSRSQRERIYCTVHQRLRVKLGPNLIRNMIAKNNACPSPFQARRHLFCHGTSSTHFGRRRMNHSKAVTPPHTGSHSSNERPDPCTNDLRLPLQSRLLPLRVSG